jgi:hypothetical protein
LSENISVEIKKFESEKMNLIIDKNDNFKCFYKYIKNMISEQANNVFVDEENNKITDSLEIAEKFNENFQAHFSKNKDEDFVIGNVLNDENILSNFEISMNDVVKSINEFDAKKSSGSSFIHNKLIKSCTNGICLFLYILFQKIVFFKEIPKQLKISSVIPIIKSGKNKSYFSSYRGISVQSNILKMFESIILKPLNIFLIKNFIIPKNQYGYSKGISSFHQHIDLQKIIFDSINDKKVIAVDLIFLDMSNAFDTISHHLLLNKLYNYGIVGNSLKILKSFN